METVKFKTLQRFEGRNGYFKSSGVELIMMDLSFYNKPTIPDYLDIFPITSKGKTGRCMIQIDAESIEDFLKAVAREAGIDMLCGDELNQYKRESIKWSVEDFTSLEKEGWSITEEQAQDALIHMIRKHDCEYGTNWTTVNYYYEMYGTEAEIGTELWRKFYEEE